VPKGFYTPSLIWIPVERAPHTPLCRSLRPFAVTVPIATRIVTPTQNQTVSGKDVDIRAVTSGPGKVSAVSLVLTHGSTVIPLGTASPAGSGWGDVWNTLSTPNGVYELRSSATNTAGFAATSAAVTVVVDNPA
jgi:hypothetical protein